MPYLEYTSADFRPFLNGMLVSDEILIAFLSSVSSFSRRAHEKLPYYISRQASVAVGTQKFSMTAWLDGVLIHNLDMDSWLVH